MIHQRDPFSFLNFHATYKQAFDSNRIHKTTAVWFVEHFMSNSAAAVFAWRLYLKIKNISDKQKGTRSVWKEVVYHLLETYTTDDIIAKTELKM